MARPVDVGVCGRNAKMLTLYVSLPRVAASVLFTLAAAGAFAQSADLAVTKIDSSDSLNQVVAGTNVTYTITLTNTGPDAAVNVTLSDAIPANTTFVSASQTSGPAFVLSAPPAGGTGSFTATNSSLSIGMATFELVVHVGSNVTSNTPPFAVVNTATVTSATADPNSANNSDTESAFVITRADLVVTKTDSPDPVARGGNITYTITAANNGPSDANAPILRDRIPANTRFVSWQQTSGPTFNDPTIGTGIDGSFVATTISTFAAGAIATFELVVTVDPAFTGPSVANTATWSTQSTTDPNDANNTDTEVTAVSALPDLIMVKNDDDLGVTAGTDLVYELTITHAGGPAATNVSMSDPLPPTTTFVSATQNSGPAFTLSAPPVGGTGTFTATIATFPVGATATFTLVVRVDAERSPALPPILNTATVSHADADPTPTNNSSTATTAVGRQSDLSVTKTDAADLVAAGSDITYALTLANHGPSYAPTVTLQDIVPANTTFVSFSQNSGVAFTPAAPPSGGTGTVTATGVEMPVGTTATFTLVVRVNASTPNGTLITNTATVTTPVDPRDTNNSDTETTTVGQPDLTLAKAAPPSAVAGGIITYTIALANGGAAPASNVSLLDPLPANTTFVSFQQTNGPAFLLVAPPAGGTGTVSATIPTFAPGATASFELAVRVSGAAGGTAVANTATATFTNAREQTAGVITNVELPAAIPTASTWMLIALASVLVLVAVMKLRAS